MSCNSKFIHLLNPKFSFKKQTHTQEREKWILLQKHTNSLKSYGKVILLYIKFPIFFILYYTLTAYNNDIPRK